MTASEHYLQVTEKRNKKSRKILLDAARALMAYIEAAGIADDAQGPLFRPMTKDGLGLERRHMDRKTPWRLVKYYCRAAGINPDRIDGRGIGIHSLRKTAINDAIRNGAQMHEVREFAGHSDIRTTELYFVRKEEDAEMAARRIQIRVSGKKTTFARSGRCEVEASTDSCGRIDNLKPAVSLHFSRPPGQELLSKPEIGLGKLNHSVACCHSRLIMTQRAHVKPELLVWARQSMRLSIEEAERRIRAKVSKWESGELEPTVVQLREACRVYRRPMAAFFLPEPPTTFSVPHDYRRAPRRAGANVVPGVLGGIPSGSVSAGSGRQHSAKR